MVALVTYGTLARGSLRCYMMCLVKWTMHGPGYVVQSFCSYPFYYYCFTGARARARRQIKRRPIGEGGDNTKHIIKYY